MEPDKPHQLDYSGPTSHPPDPEKSKKLFRGFVIGVVLLVLPALGLVSFGKHTDLNWAIGSAMLEVCAVATILLASLVCAFIRPARAYIGGLLLAIPVGGLISFGICAVGK